MVRWESFVWINAWINSSDAPLDKFLAQPDYFKEYALIWEFEKNCFGLKTCWLSDRGKMTLQVTYFLQQTAESIVSRFLVTLNSKLESIFDDTY